MERMDDKTDSRMDDISTVITELEMIEDVVVKDPTSIKEEVNEDAANKESMDTTDKRNPNYNARQASTFAAKKTVAQGMMDVALITANANQLRYLIEYQRNSPMFYVVMILIIISLLLQIAVGISLIFKGRFDIKGKSKSVNAQRINNYVVVAVFLITIINVFIAAFSITPNVLPSLTSNIRT
ncbi:ninjurin-A-like [Linepithema humile]|uniref:ninjurin-A-like n=1 Tax=Linepithema humile TaxID=83485 RepID=UPI0006233DEB|nr:PREDICTED: ninjurin-1-like [Linepithema humile]XP_012214571.1 PREDICTED: ninjurin-1-like [Linepithema humile]XP_012214572.1 PREDICTED: ninjurin-1-like [Linepithema humile]XP_012214573.1 PREDICTED: ninjurin-1-like [Linepithema humile]XP_012214574.1 PREDICTED: ninjurin-1-like [Linepithema humile]